jgi:glutamate--cysteine ligase
MTARTRSISLACPHGEALTSLEAARERVAATALSVAPAGRVGLELEMHLVDLSQPRRRPTWERVGEMLAGLPAMPAGSTVTVEPGGQVELSTRPADGVGAAVAALRDDSAVLRSALAAAGFGTAALGADPARPVSVLNHTGRYGAMHAHFLALGCAGPGRAMMAATAALQVNVDAGEPERWTQRVEHLHRIGPALLAMSACSPMLAGRRSGWSSMRQEAWSGLDAGRVGRFATGDPREAWAEYALAAPVMLVRDERTDEADAVPARVSFASWITGDAKLVRRPTLRDLDYHLTTLFPPVRPRGYLELRYLDAVPARWWPGLAAVATLLADDPNAGAAADEACEQVAGDWDVAARKGLRDPALLRAARACVRAALERTPEELRADVAAYAELVDSGRSPGDLLATRIEDRGPLAALEEEARAER